MPQTVGHLKIPQLDYFYMYARLVENISTGKYSWYVKSFVEAEDALLYLYDLIIDILYLYFHFKWFDYRNPVFVFPFVFVWFDNRNPVFVFPFVFVWIDYRNVKSLPPGPRWDPPAQSRQILHDDDADPDLQHDDENLLSLQKWQKLLIISYFLQN